MGNEIDLEKYEIRTDLVLDSIENGSYKVPKNVEKYGDIVVTTVVLDEDNSNLLAKKAGDYITIEFEDVTDSGNSLKVEEVFTKELKKLLVKKGLKDNSTFLVVGLGNESSTPDSLGPRVGSNIIVTRHLYLLNEEVSSSYRCTSVVIPDVMANTGIESFEIVSSVIDKVSPSFVIAVDALAASSIDRVNRSIQITDTGIHPGSGVGNQRKEISFDTLGIPVIAVGVPTVVESSIIVYDTINYLFKHISYIKDNQSKNKLIFSRSNYINKIKDKSLSLEEKRDILGMIGELSDNDKKSLIDEVLTSVNYNFIVTPKEVDFVIDKLSSIISNGINKCLHDI